MRGGDRLVQECSWMNGICFNFHHSTYCYGDFKLSPPLISHNENIGSEVPLFCCDSFPPGEAKNSETMRYYHSTERSVTGASGRQVGDPYICSGNRGQVPFQGHFVPAGRIRFSRRYTIFNWCNYRDDAGIQDIFSCILSPEKPAWLW